VDLFCAIVACWVWQYFIISTIDEGIAYMYNSYTKETKITE
jgi:hypothetical protein